MPSKKEVGNRGEDLAAQYLQIKGYQILARNWRQRTGELDLVALRQGVLVIGEVKSSRYAGEAHPEIRVDRRKQMQLARLARAYLAQNPATFHTVRFDVITIHAHQGREVIEHYENAFWPPEGWEA